MWSYGQSLPFAAPCPLGRCPWGGREGLCFPGIQYSVAFPQGEEVKEIRQVCQLILILTHQPMAP